MKYIISLILIILSFLSFSMAESYIYFHQNGCPHCAKVNEFFQKNNIMENYEVQKKEITQGNNAQKFGQVAKSLGITDGSKLGVPFIAIKSGSKYTKHFMGDQPIISYFEEKIKNDPNYNPNKNGISNNENSDNSSNSNKNFFSQNQSLLIFVVILIAVAGLGYYLSAKNKK